MNKIIFIIFFNLLLNYNYGQINIETIKLNPKNSTQVTFGGPYFFNLSLSHEFSTKARFKLKPFIGVVKGAFYASDDTPPGGFVIGLDIVILSNPLNKFEFDFGIGLTLYQFSKKYDFPIIHPRISYARRFNFKKGFIKMGVGYPDMLFLSFGIY